MEKYNWSEEKIRAAIADNINYTDVLRALGIPVCGNNTTTLKKKIGLYSIDVSHFTFSPKRRGHKRPIESYLINGSYCNRALLKDRLIKAGYKRNVCEICGISEWNGKPLTMQMHHKDGDNKNNNLDNLMMICPNCHAQTENYRGAANRTTDKPVNHCQDCGRMIRRTSIRCPSCAAKNRIDGRVTINLTIDKFKQYKQMGYPNTLIAKECGVTENAIRKWRRNRGL